MTANETSAPALNRTHGSGYRNGKPVVHWTTAPIGTPIRKIKPLCGQRSRQAYYTFVETNHVVNCEKCLAHPFALSR